MARVRMELNRRGFRELRQSAGVRQDIDARTRNIADAAGPGYKPSTIVGRTRARGSVITADGSAIRDNARHNTLLRSLWAGRRA